MEMDEFTAHLTQFCKRKFAAGEELSDLSRLSGGASMESWSFIFADEHFVLRRLPDGIGSELSNDDYGLSGIPLSMQADIIEAARASGVTAPKVRARLSETDGIGEGFIMDKIRGETLPHRILGKPEFVSAEAKLIEQCAAELAAIHNMDATKLPDGLDDASPAQMVQRQYEIYQRIGGDIATYDYAFRWLRDNIPETTVKLPLHGDFRMGNLMIDANGIAAVLDWELVHFGDPAQDLAYFCTPSWRFGHYDEHAGGIGSAEALLGAYTRAGGTEIKPARFQYWLVYSTLWWGIACMVMGDIWRSGADRTLERAVIGRRVSEVEVDLLLLFEEILDLESSDPLAWEAPQSGQINGETQYTELLTALSEWNQKSILPAAKGHEKFQSRVAANALGIAQRQAEFGPAYRAASGKRLTALNCNQNQLCQRLADGTMDLNTPGLWDHLRLSALERLTIDQPKYAGLHAAQKKWT